MSDLRHEHPDDDVVLVLTDAENTPLWTLDRRGRWQPLSTPRTRTIPAADSASAPRTEPLRTKTASTASPPKRALRGAQEQARPNLTAPTRARMAATSFDEPGGE